MARKVTVWVVSHPLKGEDFSEALRMSVGLTIAGNEVKVILSNLPPEEFLPENAGVPSHQLHLQTLIELKVPVVCLEGESEGVNQITEEKAYEIVEDSDLIIFY